MSDPKWWTSFGVLCPVSFQGGVLILSHGQTCVGAGSWRLAESQMKCCKVLGKASMLHQCSKHHVMFRPLPAYCHPAYLPTNPPTCMSALKVIQDLMPGATAEHRTASAWPCFGVSWTVSTKPCTSHPVQCGQRMQPSESRLMRHPGARQHLKHGSRPQKFNFLH